MPSQEQVNALIEERGRLRRQQREQHPGAICREIAELVEKTTLLVRLAAAAQNDEVWERARSAAMVLAEAQGFAHGECLRLRMSPG